MCSRVWFQDEIRKILPHLDLSAAQVSMLHSHFEMLNRWNERMDLTSVDTPEEVVSRHYCESLFFAGLVQGSCEGVSVIDFGSGAGFPGVPLAVLNSGWRVTLLEANQRRAVFLKEATRDLPNVAVVAERGENYHEPHDYVVARAVKTSDVLNCLPKLAPRVGLLVSDTVVSGLPIAAFVWTAPVNIPWSESRCCIFGECST